MFHGCLNPLISLPYPRVDEDMEVARMRMVPSEGRAVLLIYDGILASNKISGGEWLPKEGSLKDQRKE